MVNMADAASVNMSDPRSAGFIRRPAETCLSVSSTSRLCPVHAASSSRPRYFSVPSNCVSDPGMEAGNVALFSTLWIIPSFCDPADPVTITVEPGQNATSPCQHNISWNSLVLNWSRIYPFSEDVLLYRDKRVDLEHQHQSYENRVASNDTKMKDGDSSLVSKNVTINDSGTYQCLLDCGGPSCNRDSPTERIIRIIRLNVHAAAPPPAAASGRGHFGPFSGGSVFMVIISMVVASIAGSVQKKMKNGPLPHNEAVETLLV